MSRLETPREHNAGPQSITLKYLGRKIQLVERTIHWTLYMYKCTFWTLLCEIVLNDKPWHYTQPIYETSHSAKNCTLCARLWYTKLNCVKLHNFQKGRALCIWHFLEISPQRKVQHSDCKSHIVCGWRPPIVFKIH